MSKKRRAAQIAFSEKKYERAITLLRKHLRKYKQDYDGWTELGSAYYHVGVAKKADRLLRFSENKTRLKGQNFYYQGLSNLTLGNKKKARTLLRYAANSRGPFAALATYELGASLYLVKQRGRASYWLRLLLQRFPRTKWKSEANRMLASIRKGIFLKDVKRGLVSPTSKSVYKYNKLSLFPYPHFWLTELGGGMETQTVFQPTEDSTKFAQRDDVSQRIIAVAGIGLGPIKQGNSSVLAGYTYRQNWLTDPERLSIFFGEAGFDLEYQPFRADLLERTHQMYGDLRFEFINDLYTGLYGKWEIQNIGSDYFESVGVQQFNRKQNIADTILLIPWAGYAWNSYMRSTFYAYMRKQFNDESPDFDNKTYGSDGQTSVLSWGLTHAMTFPSVKVDANLEFFKYDFIYNDPWSDYSRLGGIATIEHQLIPRFYLQLTGGTYQDSYVEPRTRIGSCDLTSLAESIRQEDSGESSEVEDTSVEYKDCLRDDTGIMFGGALFWNYSQFHRIKLGMNYVSNTNEKIKEHDSTSLSFYGTFSMAFPSVKRVVRFAERFSDVAFTKKPQ